MSRTSDYSKKEWDAADEFCRLRRKNRDTKAVTAQVVAKFSLDEDEQQNVEDIVREWDEESQHERETYGHPCDNQPDPVDPHGP